MAIRNISDLVLAAYRPSGVLVVENRRAEATVATLKSRGHIARPVPTGRRAPHRGSKVGRAGVLPRHPRGMQG